MPARCRNSAAAAPPMPPPTTAIRTFLGSLTPRAITLNAAWHERSSTLVVAPTCKARVLLETENLGAVHNDAELSRGDDASTRSHRRRTKSLSHTGGVCESLK